MHRFMIALLMFVVAGAHSAAALGVGGGEAGLTVHAHEHQVAHATSAAMDVLPPMECCKDLETATPGSQSTSCSSDCPWLFGEIQLLKVPATVTCEGDPPLKLSAWLPAPDHQPPRQF